MAESVLSHPGHVSKLAQGNWKFTLDLYKTLKSSTNKNVIFSPFSITSCVALCYAGAKNKTESQIREVFNFPEDNAFLHEAFEDILESLTPGKLSDQFTLQTANRLYIQETLAALENYLAVLTKHYKTEIGKADFVKEHEKHRVLINSWVEEITRNKIKNLLPQGILNPLTRAVLVNAIYFKGDWKHKFDKAATRVQPFYLTKDDTVDVDMMFQKREFKAFRNPTQKYQMLELPYVGDRLSMLLILPDIVDGLGALEENLTAEEIKNGMSQMRSIKYKVSLPRFCVEETAPLKELLQKMGITDLFSEQLADLSGIVAGKDLFVSDAVHKAFLEVNEEGSEAAAATAMVVQMRMAMLMEPEFIANHPFMIIILDKVTDLVLFMGSLSSPTPSQQK